MRRFRTILAFLLFFACLASSSVVSVVSPVNQSFDSSQPNAVVDLGSFPGGAVISVSFSRDAGGGKKWDYAIPVEAFRPSGWTTQQSGRDSLLVVSFTSAPYSNGSYLLKVMLADSDEGTPPQTVSFKANLSQASAFTAAPIVQAPPAPPAPAMDWEMALITFSVLGVLALLVATFYLTAPARKRARMEEERRRKELKERLARKAPAPVVLPTKKIIVIEDEKKPAGKAPAAEKFVLKQAAPPSIVSIKAGEIEVPVRRILSEPAPKKAAGADAMKAVSIEELGPRQSTKDVLRDIDSVLKDLKPKYGLAKPEEKEKSVKK
ncbi:MAG: hypothetical protein AB1626_04810 [Candidatus Micrarchaeota archaeon]